MWYARNIIILHSTSGNLKNSQSLTDLPKTVADANMKTNATAAAAVAAAAAGQIATGGMCIVESNVMYLTRAATWPCYGAVSRARGTAQLFVLLASLLLV